MMTTNLRTGGVDLSTRGGVRQPPSTERIWVLHWLIVAYLFVYKCVQNTGYT